MDDHDQSKFIGKNGRMGYHNRMIYHKHKAHQLKLAKQAQQTAATKE